MITFTDRAREVVASLLQDSEGELEALRITMQQTGDNSPPHFDLTLVGADEREPDDQEEDVGEFSILINQSLVNQLEGATVDPLILKHQDKREAQTLSSLPACVALPFPCISQRNAFGCRSCRSHDPECRTARYH